MLRPYTRNTVRPLEEVCARARCVLPRLPSTLVPLILPRRATHRTPPASPPLTTHHSPLTTPHLLTTTHPTTHHPSSSLLTPPPPSSSLAPTPRPRPSLPSLLPQLAETIELTPAACLDYFDATYIKLDPDGEYAGFCPSGHLLRNESILNASDPEFEHLPWFHTQPLSIIRECRRPPNES